MSSTPGEAREDALNHAAAFLRGREASGGDLIDLASAVYGFLNPAVRLILHRGPITDQATGKVVDTTQEDAVATQLKDTQQVVFTVEVDDAKGYATIDPNALTATIDDSSVATASQDGNTITVVAQAPGNAVLSVTDGVLTATEAVDVIAGDAASFKITGGEVTDQTP